MQQQTTELTRAVAADWTVINKTAEKIRERQKRATELETEFQRADRWRGGLGSRLWWAERSGHPAEVGELRTAYDESDARVKAIREERRETVEELDTLNGQLTAAHNTRRIRLALGGQTLTIPPLPVAADATLDALTAQLAELQEKLRRADPRAARQRVIDADDRVKSLRVDFLRGSAKRQDIVNAERDAKAAADAHDTVEQECQGLTAAVEAVARDRDARAEIVYAQRVPALKEEYRKRLTAFADALRAAAIACEAVMPVVEALQAESAMPMVTPWHELRVLIHESKFRRWMVEASEAGYLNG